MSPRVPMSAIGLLAFTLGCPGGEPPKPGDVEEQDRSLQWERVGEEVVLTSRSPERLYLVVRSGPSGDRAGVTFEKDAMRIAEGVVYELKPVPLLTCGSELHCQECRPDPGGQPDCVWPPPPPSPGGFVVLEGSAPSVRGVPPQR